MQVEYEGRLKQSGNGQVWTRQKAKRINRIVLHGRPITIARLGDFNAKLSFKVVPSCVTK